ncbi:hypothetical protein LC653_37915 [Nostoc sp. CHAB 5784]|uniref:hypothetical protein n=1 Tax=Nostoc mirabile TaxID=2907820 RepID=UPI001E6586FB|nr:hypothetical protein [Nostoc mirabile]MCC5669460.1 hypothetical protein [Nostoc mirabile CHAB5784]
MNQKQLEDSIFEAVSDGLLLFALKLNNRELLSNYIRNCELVLSVAVGVASRREVLRLGEKANCLVN